MNKTYIVTIHSGAYFFTRRVHIEDSTRNDVDKITAYFRYLCWNIGEILEDDDRQVDGQAIFL